MNNQLLFRLTVDFIMTALILAAFAYQLTGNLAHEVIGFIIFLLFIIHQVINRRWYKNLFKGKYNLRRTLGTGVNLLLVIVTVLFATSGVMISHDIFSFLRLDGGFEIRQLHTLCAFWGLVLISVHVGIHWNMILETLRKVAGLPGTNHPNTAAPYLLSAIIAVYGVKSSFDMNIGSKLFLQYTFSYWNFESDAAGFFLAYISIMGLYITITHCTLRLLQKSSSIVEQLEE